MNDKVQSLKEEFQMPKPKCQMKIEVQMNGIDNVVISNPSLCHSEASAEES